MPRCHALPAILAVALCAPVAAAPGDRVIKAEISFSEPILVSARAPLKASEIGNSVTLLTGGDLERLQSPLLLDVLRLQPGVTLTRNGGPGGFTAVRLRGAEGEQTTLVIDGVKVADPASPGGGTDFATLGTQHLARVEILRGPQSLAWGSQAIGGVIAIETDWPEDVLAVGARVEAGSRETLLGRADIAGRVGPVRLSAGGNWQSSDGISAFSEARGGVERDGFESWGGNLRAEVPLGGGFLVDLRGRFQDSRFGIDGFPPPAFRFGDTPDRSRSREAQGVAALVYSAGRVTARAGWQLSDIARRTATPGATPEIGSRFEGRTERLDLRLDWTAAPGIAFAGGLERELTRSSTASRFAPDPFRARATLVGGFLQALLEPLPGLNVNAGLRHDDHSRFGGATTFAANASFRPGEGPIRLRASYGEGFKAPTLFQLFSEFGNEGLRPERATGWDAGVDLRLVEGNFRAGLTWFERRTRDQIDFQSCFGAPEPLCADGRFGFYANLDRTSARGLEAVLGFDPAPGLVVDAQYSYVDARNRAEGDPAFGLPLLRRPEHSLSAIIDYRAPAGWSVGATLAHLSSSIDEDFEAPPFGRVRLEGHVLADVRAGLALTEGLELYGRVTNLFDERYETVLRYGQPGRQAFIGIRARY